MNEIVIKRVYDWKVKDGTSNLNRLIRVTVAYRKLIYKLTNGTK
ncbi:hypothetical protein [Flavobacterium sp. DSR3-2]